jgi:protein-arginine kinase activator protein McsA
MMFGKKNKQEELERQSRKRHLTCRHCGTEYKTIEDTVRCSCEENQPIMFKPEPPSTYVYDGDKDEMVHFTKGTFKQWVKESIREMEGE